MTMAKFKVGDILTVPDNSEEDLIVVEDLLPKYNGYLLKYLNPDNRFSPQPFFGNEQYLLHLGYVLERRKE